MNHTFIITGVDLLMSWLSKAKGESKRQGVQHPPPGTLSVIQVPSIRPRLLKVPPPSCRTKMLTVKSLWLALCKDSFKQW